MKMRTRGQTRTGAGAPSSPPAPAASRSARPRTGTAAGSSSSTMTSRKPARARVAPKGGVQKRKVAPLARRAPQLTRVGPRKTSAKAPPDDQGKPGPRKAREKRSGAVEVNDESEDVKEKTSPGDCVTDEHDGKEVEEAEEEEKQVKTIDDLPEDVMLSIFSYFRPPQLCWKIGRVCRRWAAWSVSPFLWRGREYILSPDPSLASRRKK